MGRDMGGLVGLVDFAKAKLCVAFACSMGSINDGRSSAPI